MRLPSEDQPARPVRPFWEKRHAYDSVDHQPGPRQALESRTRPDRGGGSPEADGPPNAERRHEAAVLDICGESVVYLLPSFLYETMWYIMFRYVINTAMVHLRFVYLCVRLFLGHIWVFYASYFVLKIWVWHAPPRFGALSPLGFDGCPRSGGCQSQARSDLRLAAVWVKTLPSITPGRQRWYWRCYSPCWRRRWSCSGCGRPTTGWKPSLVSPGQRRCVGSSSKWLFVMAGNHVSPLCSSCRRRCHWHNCSEFGWQARVCSKFFALLPWKKHPIFNGGRCPTFSLSFLRCDKRVSTTLSWRWWSYSRGVDILDQGGLLPRTTWALVGDVIFPLFIFFFFSRCINLAWFYLWVDEAG
jgi:hypothetical protein